MNGEKEMRNITECATETKSYTVATLHAQDAGIQATNLARWEQTYVQLSPGKFDGTLTTASFDEIQIIREVTNQEIYQQGTAEPGTKTFCFPYSLKDAGYYRGVAISNNTLATLNGNEEFELHTPREFGNIAVTVDLRLLDDYALTFENPQVDPGRARGGMLTLQENDAAELRRLFGEIFDMLERDAHILQYPAVRRSLESTIIGNIMSAIGKADSRSPVLKMYSQRKHAVDRAIAYVLSRPYEAVTVMDLCRELRMSRRTLQLCFADVLQTSPLQYLRAVRLNQVRRQLLSAPPSTGVHDIASQWGFWHFSQFATDYKKQFGELPSETLADARRQCVAADSAQTPQITA